MLVDQQFLLSMFEKVWTQSHGPPVSEQFALAVCHIISQHAVELSPYANQQLAFALTEKLKCGAPALAVDASSTRDLTTTHYLQESLQKLSRLEPLRAQKICY